MTQVIRDQIVSLQDAAWHIDHRRALARFDLVDVIDVGLSALHNIRDLDARYRERVNSRAVALDKGVFVAIQRLYEDWYNLAGTLLKQVEAFEADGLPIQNSEELRRECRTSHIPEFEPERLNAAAQRFAEGKSRSLGEVMDAIRSRAGK